MASEGLSSGLVQFSPTSSFVPWEGGDIKDFRVDLRPDLKHWGGGRPALKKSLADLEKELMRVGGQPECTYLQEYSMRAKVKLAFDYEKVVPVPVGEQECYRILEADLLRPVCNHIRLKTNIWMLDDLVVSSCHRKLDEHRFKISFHVFFIDVVIVANQISVLADQLQLPAAVDRSPWTGNKRRLLRLVGACKEGETAYMKPMSTANKMWSCRGWIDPLHDHILTFVKGSEYDLTPFVSGGDSPAKSKQRTERVCGNPETRSYIVAPWLEAEDENEYRSLASQALNRSGMRSGYTLGRLKGAHMYATTIDTGRTCAHAARHHTSNRFYVEFAPSGEMMYHCFADACRKEIPLPLGMWRAGIQEMLNNPGHFKPGRDVDKQLMANLYDLALRDTPKHQPERMRHQPWYRQLAHRVSTYLGNFFVFVEGPNVYVKQFLDDDGLVVDFNRYKADAIKSVVTPYSWGFNIWNTSPSRTERLRFVGKPIDNTTGIDEYNLCANKMPNLRIPYSAVTVEELTIIQPLLDHIRDCLCAGVDEDFAHFMQWLGHLAQKPDRKTGWTPLFESEQGVGKGLIFSGLLKGIFQDLALHVTNFKGVVNRFNGQLAMKTFVFVDEGMFMGDKAAQDSFKTAVTEDSMIMEEKFQNAVTLPSFHNYLIATNHSKAVCITNSDRRFFMQRCRDLKYKTEHWSKLWALVKDEDARILFFQHLRGQDLTGFQIGRAPETAVKSRAIADQAPVAIQWLRQAVLDEGEASCMCTVPRKLPSEFCYDFQDGAKEAFRLKHRPRTEAFANLIGDEYEEAMLQRELLTSSEVAIKVPVSHVYDTIHSCFDKQRYQQQNDSEYRAALKKIGLKTKTASVMNWKCKCYHFPSIEGLKHMLGKEKYLNDADSDEEMDN